MKTTTLSIPAPCGACGHQGLANVPPALLAMLGGNQVVAIDRLANKLQVAVLRLSALQEGAPPEAARLIQEIIEEACNGE